MDATELTTLLSSPEVLRNILRGYDGLYSLGVRRDIDNSGNLAIILRVEGEKPIGMPNKITIRGHKFSLIVEGSFQLPQAL